jgi:hypothetical protein
MLLNYSSNRIYGGNTIGCSSITCRHGPVHRSRTMWWSDMAYCSRFVQNWWNVLALDCLRVML